MIPKRFSLADPPPSANMKHRMKRWQTIPAAAWLWLAILAGLIHGSVFSTAAAEFKIKAQLIWGTDISKPYDPSLKNIEPALKEKLARVFRRTYYYEVDRQQLTVAALHSSLTSMSHECVIEVEHLGESNFRVSLYGEGKLVQTVRQSLLPGNYLTFAGDVKKDPEQTWILALSLVKP